MTARLTGLMFAASAGGAVGSPGIEALFFARFGVQYLPFLYVILGLLTMVLSLGMTALLGRVDRRRLYVRLPLALALVLLLERALLMIDLAWLYPVFWLGMNVFWALQSLTTWGLAGMVCDMRQAKRLFPLFSAGGVLGLAAGGLLTKPLVEWMGTENLLLVWALGLAATFLLSRSLIARIGKISTARVYRHVRLSDQLQEGYRSARRSPLIGWMSLAAVFFAVLWFSLVYPFSRAAAVQFPDERSLAGFLGIFQGLSTGTAILVSLLIANRLYARLGFMTAILIYPAIYLAGFIVLAIRPAFPALVAFRFVQNVWAEGVSEGANQAMYNAVPPERREQTRAFVRGVANQLGVSLAGLLLILSEQILQPAHLYWAGIAAAAGTLFMVWQGRKAYRQAIADALRSGHAHLFYTEEQPFGGFKQDAVAMLAVVAGIHSEDPATRRVSAEILSQVPMPGAVDAMVEALKDPDASVRAALLRSIARARAPSALLEVTAFLEDPDPEVRLAAIEALRQLSGYPEGLRRHLQPVLEDPHPAVRGLAAAALLKHGSHDQAEGVLRDLAQSDTLSRIEGLKALAEWGSHAAYQLAAQALEDPTPAVRREAAGVLARIDPQQCLFPLISTLGDSDSSVREAAALAIGRVGRPALKPLMLTLEDHDREEAALTALEQLPVQEVSGAIRAYALARAERAFYYHQLWSGGLHGTGDEEGSRLAADSVREKSLRLAVYALKGIGLLTDRSAVELALLTLKSTQPEERASALEILESLGEREIVQPLLKIFDPAGPAHQSPGDAWLVRLMNDADPWLRACAAVAAKGSQDPRLVEALQRLKENDPELVVRETAQTALAGGDDMETLPTLSIMERILFLRRVPLFKELAPGDLKAIAEVTCEQAFGPGETIAEQGEQGEELYIIVSGEVGVFLRSEDGKGKEIARRKPGEVVGEMALVSQEPRMASLVAMGDARMLCIERAMFVDLLRLRPEISLAVIRVLSQRLRESREVPAH